MPISEEMKMMQHLNNAERRAVRAHRMLTHAFYCLPIDENTSTRLLLGKRWEAINELSACESRSKITEIASKIESTNWRRWLVEAEAAGLR